jgi:pimeloyl-ACP methyl ester carboxylesterase
MDGADPSQPRRRQITLEGRGPGAVAAVELGPERRPIDIVFLHANGFNALTYRTILSPVAEAGLRILAVDQRGHGATTLETHTDQRTSWYDLRDDLLALKRVLALEDVVLAGHSMGGTACLMAAAEAPEHVKRLTLFDPVVLPPEVIQARLRGEAAGDHSPLVAGARRRRAVFPSRAAALEAYRGRGAFRAWTEAMLEDYVEAGFRDLPNGEVTLACDPVWEASNFTSHDHDTWDAFRRTSRPVRILRAEHESTARVEDHLVELGGLGVAVETVPNTTHFLPMERPDVVQAALLEAAHA